MINELSGLAAAMPRTPIAELESGQAVDTYFTCTEKTTATDRNGKTYLRLKLRDATGEVSCIHFDPSEEALGVSGRRRGRGRPAPTASTRSTDPRSRSAACRLAEPDEYDAADLVPVSPVGTAELGRAPARAHRLGRASRTCARCWSAPSTARASPAPRSSSRRRRCATTTPTGTACSSTRSSSPRRPPAWRRGSTPSTATSSPPARCCTTSARRRPTPATAWRRS